MAENPPIWSDDDPWSSEPLGDEDFEKYAEHEIPERRDGIPGDYKPSRPVPDFGEDGHGADIPTEVATRSAPNVEDLILDRVLKLQGKSNRKVMKNEEEGLLQESISRQDAQHEAFMSTPSDIQVDRKIQDDYSARGSDYTIDSTSSALPKSASGALDILADGDANPIQIMANLNNEWGKEWVGWEPETLIEMAKREGVDIHRANQDKVMSLKVLVNTTLFWEKVRVFEKVCLAFSGRIVDWGNIQEPRTHEIAATISLVERYIGEREFSDEVEAFVSASAVRDGFIMMPPSLKFAGFTFAQRLVETMGDEAVERQSNLMRALDEQDVESLEAEDIIQYMRLIKCQQFVHSKIDEIRA